MLFIKILFGLLLLGSVAWFVASPSYEPAISAGTSLAALVATVRRKKRKRHPAIQSQSVAKGGIGLQAGRDLNSGDISTNRDM
jgi:hypothetical protein